MSGKGAKKKPAASKSKGKSAKQAAAASDSPFAALRALRDQLAAGETSGQGAAPSGAGGGAVRPATPAAATRGDARRYEAAHETSPTNATSDEDDLAFHRMVSGVTPLDGGPGRIAPARARAPRRDRPRVDQAAQEAEEVHEHLRALVEGGTRFETSDDGRHIEGKRIDVPPDWVRRLRRGQLPIDARLDLHGLHAGEARAALTTFLKDKRARGERCVLVVHGKGEHSPNGAGVLRGEVGAWLSQGAASNHVAAFATAQPHDGGEGAVYVLLRR